MLQIDPAVGCDNEDRALTRGFTQRVARGGAGQSIAVIPRIPEGKPEAFHAAPLSFVVTSWKPCVPP